MKKLKCPECGQELRITSFHNGNLHACMCDKCHVYGEMPLWQALTTAKKDRLRLAKRNANLCGIIHDLMYQVNIGVIALKKLKQNNIARDALNKIDDSARKTEKLMNNKE